MSTELLKSYSNSEIESAKSILKDLKGKSYSDASNILRVATYILADKSILS